MSGPRPIWPECLLVVVLALAAWTLAAGLLMALR